ncbi:hypothetical protein DTO012A9_10316 [Penicillium roqueforti]|nr:hypothetical protein DTO012A9_10316 [Penicillium roqueforti]
MWILPLVGYFGVVVGFAFLTLAIASGLYYLSELVEEHTVIARRLLTRLIYGIVAIQHWFPYGLRQQSAPIPHREAIRSSFPPILSSSRSQPLAMVPPLLEAFASVEQLASTIWSQLR